MGLQSCRGALLHRASVWGGGHGDRLAVDMDRAVTVPSLCRLGSRGHLGSSRLLDGVELGGAAGTPHSSSTAHSILHSSNPLHTTPTGGGGEGKEGTQSTAWGVKGGQQSVPPTPAAQPQHRVVGQGHTFPSKRNNSGGLTP